LGFDLKASADGVQSLANAEQPEALGLTPGGTDAGAVESNPVVFNRNSHLSVVSSHGYLDVLGLGVLDHVDQQLTHGLVEKDLHILIQRFGLLIVPEFGEDTMLLLRLFGKPVHRCCQAQFVKDGRADLEGQRARILDDLFDQLVDFVQGFGKISGRHRPPHHSQLNLRESQGLGDAIVQGRGQAASFPFLSQ
jgi:hypothetical protein